MKKKFGKLALLASLVSCSAAALAGPVPGQGSWETTLQGRDLDGNAANGYEAFYDTQLKISWLRAGSTNTMEWKDAKTWAATDRYGLSGWRLPTMTYLDTECSFAISDCGYNVNTARSEMAHLFYELFGNKSRYDALGNPQNGYGLTNTGDFQNLQPSIYWSGLEFELDPLRKNLESKLDATDANGAFGFGTHDGGQFAFFKTQASYALAVRSGDVGGGVGVVPEPQSLALALTALGGLLLARRRRSAAAK